MHPDSSTTPAKKPYPSNGRILALLAFGGFLFFWAIEAVWMAAGGVRPAVEALFCGVPLLVAAGLVALVFRLTRRS